MMGMGEKPRNIQRAKTKEKIPLLVALPSPFYDMVSENAENKPDLA